MTWPADRGREWRLGGDADEERATVLRLQEVAYQAALASTADVLLVSVRDFLR